MAHLPECLTTLEQQDIAEPFDVVLADNASKDGSVDYVRTHHPRVRIVETGSNLGFAGACNAGIRATSGEYIVLLNNDTRLPPSWLRELVSVADASPPDVFAVGSLLLLYHYPDRINSAGGLFSPMGGGFDLHLGAPLASTPIPESPYETGVAPGAAVLYRRKIYDRLGGLDDRYFLYFEDVELCYRAWKQGYRCLMAPKARIYHKHGGTVGPRDSLLKVYWGQRNRLRMIWRNLGPRATARTLLNLGLYTSLKTIQLRLRGDGRLALELWRATARGFADRRALRAIRNAEKPMYRLGDRDLERRRFVATVRCTIYEARRLRRLAKQGIKV